MSKIVDRIKKLIELSKNNNSPEEAAQAAAMAQDMMFRHSIGEADLETTEERTPEEILETSIHEEKQRSVWKASLALGLAQSLGCEMYSDGTTKGRNVFRVYGLASATQTASYLFAYLTREIERLADQAHRAHSSTTQMSTRTWKNSFKLGAVNTIRKRLAEQKAAQTAHVVSAVMTNAIALYQTDAERVANGYEGLKKKMGLRSIRSGGRNVNPTAFQHGSNAGANLSLGGGKGLPASASRITA